MSRSSTFGPSIFLGEGALSGIQVVRRAPTWVAVALWLAAGLSAGYWLLQVLGHSPVTPVVPVGGVLVQPDVTAVSRALGGTAQALPASAGAPAAAPTLASRYQLLGVVASGATGNTGGAALIAIDGQPPRPYRLGAALEGGVVLRGIARRSVVLAPAEGDAASGFELVLPDMPGTSS